MTNTNLVPVFTGTLAGQSTQLCNARDLHATLENGDHFATWIKERIEKYGFTEGEDFFGNSRKTRGRPATDYHLTLDMAKELAMVENNDKGRQVRRYFIEVEKKAKAPAITPVPPAMIFDRDTQSQINRHAWQLAQSSFEHYRHDLEFDLKYNLHKGPISDWKPREFRDDTLKLIACTATTLDHQIEMLHDQGRKLAALTGTTYHEKPTAYRPTVTKTPSLIR